MLRTLSLVTVVALLTLLTVSVAPAKVEQSTSTIMVLDVASPEEVKATADAIATFFKITNRPKAITTEIINSYLTKLPGFGPGTKGLEALLGNAPIATFAKLIALGILDKSTNRYSYPISQGEATMLGVLFDLTVR